MSEATGIIDQMYANLELVRNNARIMGRDDIVVNLIPYLRGQRNPRMAVRALWEVYHTEFNSRKTIRGLFSGYEKLEGAYPVNEIERFRENVEPAILRDIE